MQVPSSSGGHTQAALAALAIGLLMVIVPLALLVGQGQPFPGVVAQNSEVVPVLGMLITCIATLVLVQDMFGF